MNKILSNYLSSLEFGKQQQFKNMGVIPLLTSINHSPKYLSLKEALEKSLLTVTEVSQEGSVPELKVMNKAEIPVLMLDGEELVGAKQNRVLNTSILLKKTQETKIPVSCTEQGRWSYTSKELTDSNVITHTKLRRAKARSVTQSLKRSRRFEADQGEVWGEIHALSTDTGVYSPTTAIKDIFETKAKDLEEYLKSFAYMPHQKGLLVIINDEAAGLDMVSLESVYKALHPKIVKSYAMEALLQKEEKSKEPTVEQAMAFLKAVAKCKEKKYKSIGHGWDYRFESDDIVGSALMYRNKVIHTAFFRITEEEKAGRITSLRQRRSFRV